MELRVACSPDADDLFMMRALLEGLIDTGRYSFTITTEPTDDLNRLATEGGPEILAISVAHFPHIADTYQLLPHGGSMGEGYGPVVVAPEPIALEALAGRKVAVPGLTTTAWHLLQMMVPVDPVVVPIAPYALTFDALRDQRVEAALIIHEGRLTFAAEGFTEVADLGRWWSDVSDGLPLPLGANSIRRDLGDEVIAEVSDLLRQSIAHALEHRDEAIQWLLDQGGALTTHEQVSTYLDMYANARTLDYGPEGRLAILTFLEQAADMGLLPEAEVDFAP